ncbi:keratin-associated protein 13-1-like, partial [Orycteropus afer afer]|uniref:Keratin-associated protein 13-1-like n=1 Tax=Orycteropus afer afer TaxID=1230840 RepID=A0AC54ZAG7_ORYAF
MSYNCCSGNFSSHSLGSFLCYPMPFCGCSYSSNLVYRTDLCSPMTCQLDSFFYRGCQETCSEPSSSQTSLILCRPCQSSCYHPRTSTLCRPCQMANTGSLGFESRTCYAQGCGSSGFRSLGCRVFGFPSLGYGSRFCYPTYFPSRSKPQGP